MEAYASALLALPESHDRFAMRRHHAHLSDEALVALVARGDEDALAELYDRIGRIGYGLALRVLRDERHAEDAVQEAFLQVWRSAATFRAERAKASTWILTLVHRRAVDLVRREERRQADPLTDDSAAGVAPEETEEAAWLRFERERVQSALKQLPDVQREALELAYYGGFSQSELAERLGVPIVAEHAQREPVPDASDPVVQLRERVLVAASHERDQSLVGEMGVMLAHGEAILRRGQR